MKRLHLGCGKNPLPSTEGWVNLDQNPGTGVDVVFNLENCAKGAKLPFDDDTFDEVYGSHVIEHIVQTLPLMQELHRVAKPGAKLLFKCPYGSSDDAWENPTHVRPYFLLSFCYFSQPFFWREDYGYRGDWLCDRIDLLVKQSVVGQNTAAEMMDQVMHLRNIVTEMQVNMTALKPIREAKGDLQVAPKIQFVVIPE